MDLEDFLSNVSKYLSFSNEKSMENQFLAKNVSKSCVFLMSNLNKTIGYLGTHLHPN